MFILRDFLTSFLSTGKPRVGFMIGRRPAGYHQVMASTRLRAYDVIRSPLQKKYHLELYKPWRRYDLLIFQKNFNPDALAFAQRAQQKGTKIILDINVNYFDASFLTSAYRYLHDDIMRFTELADSIITPSPFIRTYANRLFPHKRIVVIPEMIVEQFFSVRKKPPLRPTTLIYSGYAAKAPEVHLIEKNLQNLGRQQTVTLLCICDSDPQLRLSGINYRYVKYRQARIHRQLLAGDIAIAPRDLRNAYNRGHSFTKIGYPMAVGLPVVASPVPSYHGSPAIVIDDFGSGWERALRRLLEDPAYYREISARGVRYCAEHYSAASVARRYDTLLQQLLS